MGNTFYFQWEVALMEAIQAHLGSFGVKIAGTRLTLTDAPKRLALDDLARQVVDDLLQLKFTE